MAVAQEEPHKPPEEDPTSPADYLFQVANPGLIQDEPLAVTVPAGLQPLTPKVVVPAANPITKGKYELGRQLYFDPRISQDGTVSCATCHNPAKGWTDGGPVSTGIQGQTGNRSAPTVFNTAYGKTMFWDGRAAVAGGSGPGPHGQPHRDGRPEASADRRPPADDPRLQAAVREGLRHQRHARRHGQGDRDVRAGRRPLGQFQVRQVQRGRQQRPLGERKAGHGPLRPPAEHRRRVQARGGASEGQVHHLPRRGELHRRAIPQPGRRLGCRPKKQFKDVGRWAPVPIGAKTDADRGSFKTPTVRDAELTAPYMHDGSLKTLEEVVEHYDKGGIPNPSLDPDMKPLKLTSQESADLVAFMKALTGEHKGLEELLPTLAPGRRRHVLPIRGRP